MQDYLQQHAEQPPPAPAEPEQPALTPPELVEQAYGLMQEDRQRRQSRGEQQQWGSNPSAQEPADRVLEKRLEHAEQTAQTRQETYDALAARLTEKGQEQLAQQVRDAEQQAHNIQAQRHLQERNAQQVEQVPPDKERPRPTRLSEQDLATLKEQYRVPPPPPPPPQQERSRGPDRSM